jgi:hypothetical protein
MQPIQGLGQPHKLSKAVATAEAALNERITDYNGKLAAFTDEVRALAGGEVIDVLTPDFGDRAEAIRQRRMELIALELKLRADINDYLADVDGQRSKAHAAAVKAVGTFEEDLREKLIAIGYPDGNVPASATPWIIPIFFHRHPKWQELKETERNLASDFSTSERRSENNKRIEAITYELDLIRRRLVAAARA